MAETLAYAWFKTRGWLAWNTVRWFPLPLGLSQRDLIYQLSARLWGMAYVADMTRDDWREHVWSPPA